LQDAQNPDQQQNDKPTPHRLSHHTLLEDTPLESWSNGKR
jgi:hypothetical protein